MGFDLSGLNPNMSSPRPELPPLKKDLGDEEREMFAIYKEWEEENCGVYFRNNGWLWRPLWTFVARACDDILTNTDITNGSFNNGYKISKTKANKIAKRLWGLIDSGQVKEYEERYAVRQQSLDDSDRDKSYPFYEENVRRFANFCANSGGFTIC